MQAPRKPPKESSREGGGTLAGPQADFRLRFLWHTAAAEAGTPEQCQRSTQIGGEIT